MNKHVFNAHCAPVTQQLVLIPIPPEVTAVASLASTNNSCAKNATLNANVPAFGGVGEWLPTGSVVFSIILFFPSLHLVSSMIVKIHRPYYMVCR